MRERNREEEMEGERDGEDGEARIRGGSRDKGERERGRIEEGREGGIGKKSRDKGEGKKRKKS